jgi:hypothetical protein
MLQLFARSWHSIKLKEFLWMQKICMLDCSWLDRQRSPHITSSLIRTSNFISRDFCSISSCLWPSAIDHKRMRPHIAETITLFLINREILMTTDDFEVLPLGLSAASTMSAFYW